MPSRIDASRFYRRTRARDFRKFVSVREAQERGRQALPDWRGIYIFVSDPKDPFKSILYVGKAMGADGVRARVWKHIHGDGNKALASMWRDDPSKRDAVWISWRPSRIGDWREADMIRQLRPRCNKRAELAPLRRHARTRLGWFCHGIIKPCRVL